MQNKPNFKDVQMNVNIYYTKVYKNETAFRRGENKPNSNPIKANPELAEALPALRSFSEGGSAVEGVAERAQDRAGVQVTM